MRVQDEIYFRYKIETEELSACYKKFGRVLSFFGYKWFKTVIMIRILQQRSMRCKTQCLSYLIPNQNLDCASDLLL